VPLQRRTSLPTKFCLPSIFFQRFVDLARGSGGLRGPPRGEAISSRLQAGCALKALDRRSEVKPGKKGKKGFG